MYIDWTMSIQLGPCGTDYDLIRISFMIIFFLALYAALYHFVAKKWSRKANMFIIAGLVLLLIILSNVFFAAQWCY